ncbi:MAG: translation initiation factor IF-2, partial [Bacteroidota bacterium]
MAEAEKTIRLSKAVREFNLSMDHIVDFLTKKGIQVESNPNTKLPGEAYALLLKEFQHDKSLKEEAQQLAQSKVKREGAVVLDAQDQKKPASRKEDESREILIKNVAGATGAPTETPKKKKAEPEAE